MEKMPIPKGLEVLQRGETVVIRRKWRKWNDLFLLVFLIYMIGSFGPLDYGVFTHRNMPRDSVLIARITVGICVWLAYFTIVSLANRTDAIISASRVRCVIWPLPWWGNRDLAAGNIRGITVGKRVGARGAVWYPLRYVDAANKKRTLLWTPRREQADFIAASIRRILGMEEPAPQPGPAA